MRASVTFLLADGTRREIQHGDFIGRSPRAGLSLNEPTLSEAHALVSLRGSQFRLLALRGRMTVDGKPVTDLALRPGLRIVLSSRVPLVVDDIALPEVVLALEGDELPPRIISGVGSIVMQPFVDIHPGAQPEAAALVWAQGDRLWVRRAEHADASFTVGQVFDLEHDGRRTRLRVGVAALDDAGAGSTIDDPDKAATIVLKVRYDTVHIDLVPARGAPRTACVFDGKNACLLSELALMAVPCAWEVVAREVWDGAVDPATLRVRWDATIARIRRRLREAGLRADLIRATRSGQVELFLGPRDRVENDT